MAGLGRLLEKIQDGLTATFTSAAHEELSTHKLVVNTDMDNVNVPGESFAYIIDKDGNSSVTSMDKDVLNTYYGDNSVDLADMNPSGIDLEQAALASEIGTALAEHDPNALMIAGGDPEKPETTNIDQAAALEGALKEVLSDLNFKGMDAEARGFEGAQETALNEAVKIDGYLNSLDTIASLDGYAQRMTEDLNGDMGVNAGMSQAQQDAAVNYIDGASETPKPAVGLSPSGD